MSDFKEILLFEHSEEALEIVKAGQGKVSSGGIRKNTGELIEMAKPATMSIADFMALFEDKDHAIETDEHLQSLESKLKLSEKSLEEIEKIEWLNNRLAKQTYTITFEGFKRTLLGIEQMLTQLSGMDYYLRSQTAKQLSEKAQMFINYMRSDAGLMLSTKYSVVNGNIMDHLDQISAFSKRLLSEVEESGDDCFLQVQLLCGLVKPFSYIVRKYSSLYYYENDGKMVPGNYEEWVNVLSSIANSIKLSERINYYIKLKLTIPYKEKVLIWREICKENDLLLANIHFDAEYITTHSKEEYLSIDDQIRDKVTKKDFYVKNAKLIFFLDSNKEN